MFLVMMRTATNPQANSSTFSIETVKYFILFAVVQTMFLTAPNDDNHRYIVTDRITGSATTVEQIPKGLGEILKFFTNIEDVITAKMDMYFSTPDSTSYRNAGLGFSLTTANRIFQTSPLDPKFQNSLVLYIEDCKLLGDFSESQPLSDLFSVEDMVNTLSTTATNRSVLYMSDAHPEGEELTCADAWTKISDRLDTLSNETINNYA